MQYNMLNNCGRSDKHYEYELNPRHSISLDKESNYHSSSDNLTLNMDKFVSYQGGETPANIQDNDNNHNKGSDNEIISNRSHPCSNEVVKDRDFHHDFQAAYSHFQQEGGFHPKPLHDEYQSYQTSNNQMTYLQSKAISTPSYPQSKAISTPSSEKTTLDYQFEKTVPLDKNDPIVSKLLQHYNIQETRNYSENPPPLDYSVLSSSISNPMSTPRVSGESNSQMEQNEYASGRLSLPPSYLESMQQKQQHQQGQTGHHYGYPSRMELHHQHKQQQYACFSLPDTSTSADPGTHWQQSAAPLSQDNYIKEVHKTFHLQPPPAQPSEQDLDLGYYQDEHTARSPLPKFESLSHKIHSQNRGNSSQDY